jgi:hypothetical protein
MPLAKPAKPLRNHVQVREIKHWSKHWNVEPEQISAAIEKVGNSVAAIRKELCLRGLINKEI